MPRLLALGLILMLGCGEDATGPDPAPTPVDPSFEYARSRDGQGRIAPVLAESGSGFDAREVDSPSVIRDDAAPSPYFLYYEATDDAGITRIGLVRSETEEFSTLTGGRSIAIDRGGPGSGYDGATTDPAVLVDSRPASNPPFGQARYQMWFEGRAADGTSTIFFTTSSEGEVWSTPVSCSGLSPVGFASVRVADPSVVLDGDTYKMWFEAVDTEVGSVDGPARIGYAESSDGIAWLVQDAAGRTGNAATAVFEPRRGFDGYSVNAPCVVLDTTGDHTDAPYLMWYEAADAASNRQNTIGFATSVDGLTWTRRDNPVLVPSSDSLQPLPFDSGDLEHPTALLDGTKDRDEAGHYQLWYTGDGEANLSPNRIGLAEGREVPRVR